MKDEKIKKLCFTALLTALTFVFTAYLHIPSANGYVHVGDGIIFLAACLLPVKYALFVGGTGALLADCLTGYAIFAPASVIIKCLSVLLFSSREEKIIQKRNLLALIGCALLCVGGYFIYEALVFGAGAALGEITGNITQSVFSSVLFVVSGAALDRTGIGNSIKNSSITLR